MPPRGLERLATVAAVVVSGLAVALGVLVWHAATVPIDVAPLSPSRDTGPTAVAAQPETRAAAPLVLPPPRPAGREYLARPLFDPDRRPPRPPAVLPPPASPPRPASRPETPPALPPGARLLGVVGDPVRGPRALLSSTRRPAGAWLRPGEDFEGWRLVDIEAGEIALQSGRFRRRLALYPPPPGRQGVPRDAPDRD